MTEDELNFRPSRNVRGGYKWRRRRPTPFVILCVVFVVALLAVIFTSRAWRRLISGETGGDDGIYETDGGTRTEESTYASDESGQPNSETPET